MSFFTSGPMRNYFILSSKKEADKNAYMTVRWITINWKIIIINIFLWLLQIPAFLQEFEDILHSATCWLGDAQSWISAPCTYSTARSLHSHAKSLQVCLQSQGFGSGGLERIDQNGLQWPEIAMELVEKHCDASELKWKPPMINACSAYMNTIVCVTLS